MLEMCILNRHFMHGNLALDTCSAEANACPMAKLPQAAGKCNGALRRWMLISSTSD